MANGSVLLIDCGESSMELLAARIHRIGLRVVRVKNAADAYVALSNARLGISAIVLPHDAPLADPKKAIESFREVAAGPGLSIMVSGPRPSDRQRIEWQNAGAEFALFEPLDAHALRFQLNQAVVWRHSPRTRGYERVPVTWVANMRSGRRNKEGRIYTISPRGAYVALPAPWLRGTELKLELVLPEGGKLKANGVVAMTNVKGNLMKSALPVGMGIRFIKPNQKVQARLAVAVQERKQRLRIAR